MKDCYILKNKIKTLVEARVVKLKSKQKEVIANITTFQFDAIEVSTGVMPILKGKLRVVNYDHTTYGKRLAPFTSEQQEVLRVQTELLKVEQ